VTPEEALNVLEGFLGVIPEEELTDLFKEALESLWLYVDHRRVRGE
jgi:hypothetical protein